MPPSNYSFSLVWNKQGKKKRTYSYTYDELNRLLNSNHKVYNTTWGDSTSYEEKNISYDKNGNITHLLRTNQTGGTLNDFTYTYNETNQLKHLNVGGNYIYDSNGNMTTDGLKGFSVTYNLLNLPSQVSKNSENVSYIYSAAGAKLAKLQNSSLQQIYTGSLVYNSSKLLDYILNDEGMVVKQSGGFEYLYFMKDHLGNTRAVFKDSLGIAKIKQVADYYPFGSRFVPFNPESSNKYLYNNKEFQDELGLGVYDYGVRFYDPEVPRFWQIDPMAEKCPWQSPYCYAANNPIRFIDFNGLGPEDPSKRQAKAEADFAIAYPRIAAAIGSYKPGSNNISTYAGNFAINLTNNTGLTKGGEGSDRNALRHGIWQAIITRDFGKDIASQAGFAHEGFTVPDVTAISNGYSTSGKGTDFFSDADCIADLFNNQIGQSIGENNPDATNVELAGMVLNEFKENGMWTVQETETGYTITRTKITSEQYKQAQENLKQMQNNGLKKKEEKKEDEKK